MYKTHTFNHSIAILDVVRVPLRNRELEKLRDGLSSSLETLRRKTQLENFVFEDPAHECLAAGKNIRELQQTTERLRRTIAADTQAIKMPELSAPQGVEQLKARLEEVGNHFREALGTTAYAKVSEVLKLRVMHHLKSHTTKVAAVAAVAPLSLQPDQKIVADALDKLGIADAADQIADRLAEHVSVDAIESLISLSDVGVFSTIRSGIKEFDLVFSGQTSLNESFNCGMIPTGVSTCFTIAGGILDAICFTPGLFTFIGSLIGGKCKAKLLQEEIEIDQSRVREIERGRELKFADMVKAIQDSVAQGTAKYSETVLKFPKFKEQPELVAALNELDAACSADFALTCQRIDRAIADSIASLRITPEWRDQYIKFDRKAEAVNIINDCGQSMKDQIARLTSKIRGGARLANASGLEGINETLPHIPLQASGQLLQFRSKFPALAGGVVLAYQDAVDDWTTDCEKVKENVKKDVQATFVDQHTKLTNYITNGIPKLNDLFRRIKANLIRLGVKK